MYRVSAPMKTLAGVLSGVILLGSAAAGAEGNVKLDNEVKIVTIDQKWSATEAEIWKTVEAYWKVPTVGGLMEYFHEQYMGWHSQEPMPGDKPIARLWQANLYNNRKSLVLKVSPVGTRVHGEFAIVNYHYTWLYEDSKQEQHTERGRFTDILKKEGGKWLLIADHGGPTEQR